MLLLIISACNLICVLQAANTAVFQCELIDLKGARINLLDNYHKEAYQSIAVKGSRRFRKKNP